MAPSSVRHGGQFFLCSKSWYFSLSAQHQNIWFWVANNHWHWRFNSWIVNSLAWAELQYIEVPKHVHGEIFWLDLLSKIIFFLSKILPTLAIIDHNQINTTFFLKPKGENQAPIQYISNPLEEVLRFRIYSWLSNRYTTNKSMYLPRN